MASRAVPRTKIRPTTAQLEKAFDTVPDRAGADAPPPLEVVEASTTSVVEEAKEQARPSRKKKPAESKEPAGTTASTEEQVVASVPAAGERRRKQTLYLPDRVRNAMKHRAVDEDITLSDLAERVFADYLGL